MPEPNDVVVFHYRLSVDGRPVEASRERGQPLAVLLGAGNVIAGLERALAGRQAGERFRVEIAPEQAYGPRLALPPQRVALKQLSARGRLKVGEQAMLKLADGWRPVTILKLGLTVAQVDTNHPLAGKTLDFEVEVLERRPASPEELAHGHAHGPGGHRH